MAITEGTQAHSAAAAETRLAQLKASSPVRSLNLPPPPRRVTPRISHPKGVELKIAASSADDWCTEVIDWLQAVINWVKPILGWFNTVLSWLSDIAWFLNFIGLGGWLDSVIQWAQSWVNFMQDTLLPDIQTAINYARENGCGSDYIKEVIQWVEGVEHDLASAYNWLVGAINWIENLF